MSVTIRIISGGDSSTLQEQSFDQTVISIGRGSENSMVLADKHVSWQHATIEFSQGSYQVRDLDSTNGTILNGEKLGTGTLRKLHPGDDLTIGPFVLQILRLDPSQLLPPEGIPPPQDVSQPLSSESQKRIGERPESVEPEGTPSRIRESTPVHFREADVLAKRLMEVEQENEELQLENQRLKEATGTSHAQSLQHVDQSSDVTQRSLMIELLSTLLQSFAAQSRARSLFFSEFKGETRVRDHKMQALLRDPGESIQYLLDSSISPDESAARRDELKRELDELAVHTTGLLEGYRNCVDDGTRKLLAETNPEQKRIEAGKVLLRIGPAAIPYRFVPLLVEYVTAQLVRKSHQSLLRESRGTIEQRFFRAGFVRGYDSRIARGVKEDHKQEQDS